ncbi:hypothetical protein [Deinococcus sp. UR1]|uniref:hypothetical protein n=1 Tax=Deinococcus sp. UR1 TaxID=1704277 RepID=UPI0011AED13C|nr:hypothetical protein [Deinococcus sp. UR1]
MPGFQAFTEQSTYSMISAVLNDEASRRYGDRLFKMKITFVIGKAEDGNMVQLMGLAHSVRPAPR